MLVNHSNPKVICNVWTCHIHLFPIDAYFSLFGLIQSEQHIHQCRFPSTVFTQQRVDFAFFQLQSDVVIRPEISELLSNVQHLNDVFQWTHFLVF